MSCEAIDSGLPVVLFYDVLGALLERAFGDVLGRMGEGGTEAEVLHRVAEGMRQRLSEKAARIGGSVRKGNAFAGGAHAANAGAALAPTSEPAGALSDGGAHEVLELPSWCPCRGAGGADAVDEHLTVAQHYSVYVVQRVWRARAQRRAALSC